jgi:hypothetical protein
VLKLAAAGEPSLGRSTLAAEGQDRRCAGGGVARSLDAERAAPMRWLRDRCSPGLASKLEVPLGQVVEADRSGGAEGRARHRPVLAGAGRATRALVPGYRVVLEAGGERYDYHADTRGRFLLCPTERVQDPLESDAT